MTLPFPARRSVGFISWLRRQRCPPGRRTQTDSGSSLINWSIRWTAMATETSSAGVAEIVAGGLDPDVDASQRASHLRRRDAAVVSRVGAIEEEDEQQASGDER